MVRGQPVTIALSQYYYCAFPIILSRISENSFCFVRGNWVVISSCCSCRDTGPHSLLFTCKCDPCAMRLIKQFILVFMACCSFPVVKTAMMFQKPWLEILQCRVLCNRVIFNRSLLTGFYRSSRYGPHPESRVTAPESVSLVDVVQA